MLAQNAPTGFIASIKSIKFEYIDASFALANKFSFKRKQDLLGMSLYDLCDTLFQNNYYNPRFLAEELMVQEETVFRGNKLHIFDGLIVNGKLNFFINHKFPYLLDSKIVGACSQVIDLGQLNAKALRFYLSNPSLMVPKYTKNMLDIDGLAPHRKFKLTKRELQCIQLLAQGNSAKVIASKLNLSKRTIEFYISNIKEKLNVNKAPEIISKALSEGILY